MIRSRTHAAAISTLSCAAALALLAGLVPACAGKGGAATSNDAAKSTATDRKTSNAKDSPKSAKSGSSGNGGGGGAKGDTAALTGAAENLQSLYDTLGQQQAAVDDTSSARSQPTKRPSKNVQGPANGAVAIDGSPAAFQAPAPAPEPRRVETVIVDRPLNRAELAFKLADRIRAEAGWSPMRQSVALMGLEMIEPGVGAPQYDDLSRRLSGDQATASTELRRLLNEVASSEGLAGDPTQLSGALGSSSRVLAPPAAPTGLELGTVALCTRVESFGRFSPYAANRFTAGRAIPLIVYTEVENFAQSEEHGNDSTPGTRWNVQVSQELALYLDSDGSRQWRQTEQTVKDVSRSKRKDYYLVQRIDLPANLSVGRYNLKVIVRDRNASNGGGEVERTIPIEIVADTRSRD